MKVDSGSFRDPAGQVFLRQNKIYRAVFETGALDFDAASTRGIHDALIERGLLIHHEQVEDADFAPPNTIHLLQHPRLTMISYPWEWPFSMLKDAALLHLEVMAMLLPKGFWLRDASAFNVQQTKNGLQLIDTLSIGRRLPDSPWVAYGQFCAHFLAPLAMAAYRDIRLLSLWRAYIDGFPLDLAVKTIPFLRRYQPRLCMHLTLHSRMQKTADRKQNVTDQQPKRRPKVSDLGIQGLIQSLRKTVDGIQWKPSSAIWDEYNSLRTYDDQDVKQKTEFVDAWIKQLKPQVVWDLGANTGDFSILAASCGAFVVSIDGDPACAEMLYRRIGRKNNILPLTMDLANPSPGLGWNNCERLCLADRGPADMVLALALIHHLVLSAYVPLAQVAQWLASLSKNLIVEFVPPDDIMVKKLLQHRNDEHLPYDIEAFQFCFETYFKTTARKQLPNGRILYAFNRK